MRYDSSVYITLLELRSLQKEDGYIYLGVADHFLYDFKDFNLLLTEGLLEFKTGVSPIDPVPGFWEYPYQLTDKGREALAHPWNYFEAFDHRFD